MFPIVVLISGNGSNLQAIIDTLHDSAIEIRAVISSRADAFGLERAQRANIPTQVIANKLAQYDQALLDCIDQYQPQLVILAGFMRILGPEFVHHFQGRLLNIHPSLLPNYPGLNTHQRVWEAGDTEHGATVHFVTDELDGGPIIAYAETVVAPADTPETLQQKVHELEHQLYPAVIKWYAQGRLRLQQNQVLLDGKVLAKRGVAYQGE